MTEKVYEELDDAKGVIEKLKSENLEKASLCENLKRSNNEQLKRIEELNLKLKKEAQEVEAKADEAYAAKQSLEDLGCKLREKEKIIASFTSANDKLRVDFNSKLQECEAEKQKLVSSLEESNENILNLEDQNRALMDKIEVLKEGILAVSQKNCASESNVAKASKQMRERGDMFEKLEEEKVKIEEQLKWKNEQFKHLEEAHEKLRNNLLTKEKEWDMEKCTFLDDMSTLETKLDSQITLSEDLKNRLELCKQALAHEENRRKCLDIQLSESNSCFLDTKSKLERFTTEKVCVCKEMECKIREMEEENQDLVLSLNKLKKSQIREAGNSSSIEKLQNKIKTLDEINNVREAEWTSRFEKLVAELNSCRLELESKETRLKEIATEVNDYNSLVLRLTMEKEESAFMMVALKSTLLEAKSKIDEEKLKLHKQIESKETRLKEITTEVNDYNSLLLCLTMEKEESAYMMVALKSTLLEGRSKIDEEKLMLHKQIESYEKQLVQVNSELMNVCKPKEITTEVDDYKSLVLQLAMEKEEFAIMMVALKSTLLETRSKIDDEKLLLHKQLVQTKSELTNVYELLDGANTELDQSLCEINEVESELQIWKSVAEKLEVDLEVSHCMRRELEASLLAQVATEVNLNEDLKQKERMINDLEQEIKELKESNMLLQLTKENCDAVEKEMELWEKEWVAKELEAAILAQLESERIHEYEKQSLNQIVEEKDHRINNLQQIMSSLEEEFDYSTASFSSQLAKMQAEMNLFHEAWERMRTTVVLKGIEVQEKGLMIIELEEDIENRGHFVKKCLSSVNKLSSENEKLMNIIDGTSEWINKLSREDGQMMGTLRSIMSGFDTNHADGNGCSESGDQFDPVKENMNVYQSSPKRNMVENGVDERSPLRTING